MTAAARHDDARVSRIVELFEGFAPADVARLHAFYAPRAIFKDPFNEVQGVEQVQHIFAHMFESLDAPRFVVHDIVVQGDQCFLTWDFHFRRHRRGAAPMQVHGSSHLRLAADGRIARHRDYWDAAEELYERLPVLGAILRWLKRRIRA